MRRVAPASGGSGELHDAPVVDRALPNGDVYKGHFLAGAPHGNGKYVWADGCMYEGQWRRGKASGKGSFSWPSGATFQGDFRDGRIDGRGVFVGPDGAIYRGTWDADRRHGHGAKTYANGDYYEGHWRRGLQDGHGRYVWRAGNHYVGEWRAGIISGRGALFWANGCRYEGLWENGAPKGPGAFTCPDGTHHLGPWPQHHVDLSDIAPAGCKRSSVGRAPALPRICIWDSDGEASDITCDIVDTAVLTPHIPQCSASLQPEGSRPGETISKGHKNYELMLNLQLGVRHAVGKSAAKPMRELKLADFDPREKFWTRFPPEGSKLTLPHPSSEFRWKDYCPMVFRHLRKLFSVDPADYMLAICGDDALRELASPGKSGSVFYLTQDERFMIKTVKKSEAKLLIRMLPSYYKHVRRYKNSLITRFYSVHSLKPNGSQKVRFIVMGNLFCSEHRIHRRYDLKGSSHGRTADMFEEEIDETTTLKDLDLNFVFRLQRSWYKELHEQLMRDCEFLESEGIMDYSFLVGVHFRDDIPATKMELSTFTTSSKLSTYPELSTNMVSACQGGVGMPELCVSANDLDNTPDYRRSFVRLGAHFPARAERTSRSEIDLFLFGGGQLFTGNKNSKAYDVILYFGIIDILQDYDISKKLEHAYKSLQTDPNSISAVDPKLYSQRFRDFICRIFIEDS